MVGRALVRRLAREDCELVCTPSPRLDLRAQSATHDWMADARPDVVFLAAAKVGGIAANSEWPAAFLYDNLMIETNVIEGARLAGVAKLVFLGSSCIFPKFAPQPIPEESLLTGPLEPTNQWYAIAKIAGLKLCESYRLQYGCDFISAQPTNLYGPFDNFDLHSSHVLPALIRKAHEAKVAGDHQLCVWGSGAPLREFLHVDDLADALVYLAKNWSSASFVNVGSGQELSIRALAQLVAQTVGFTGQLAFDSSSPDGTPRKRVDTGRLESLGWKACTPLHEGIAGVYRWYLANNDAIGRAGAAA